MRATTSVALPGVNGTTMWIGWSGQVSAPADWRKGKSASTEAMAKTIKRFMTRSSKSEADGRQHRHS
jgi:hypothetical protein